MCDKLMISKITYRNKNNYKSVINDEKKYLQETVLEDAQDETAKWIAARRARFPTRKTIEAKKSGTFDDSKLPM
jgi:hypothetical protein